MCFTRTSGLDFESCRVGLGLWGIGDDYLCSLVKADLKRRKKKERKKQEKQEINGFTDILYILFKQTVSRLTKMCSYLLLNDDVYIYNIRWEIFLFEKVRKICLVYVSYFYLNT